jgi:hypothetical protein
LRVKRNVAAAERGRTGESRLVRGIANSADAIDADKRTFTDP